MVLGLVFGVWCLGFRILDQLFRDKRFCLQGKGLMVYPLYFEPRDV